jgi:hypothetical protein
MKFRIVDFEMKVLIPLFLLLVTFTSAGQDGNHLKINSLSSSGNIKAKSLSDAQIWYIQNSYSEKVQVPKDLINGKEYESYYTRSKSKPLLYIDKKRTATVFTPTRQYNNLTLQYDTFLDEVIYTDTSRTINYRFPEIALNKDIVDGFNLYFADDSLIFRYFKPPECTKNNLKEGYYEVGYLGKSRYVIKHESSFYVREGLNEYKYVPENYISVGDVFYRVKNRSGLLKLFGDKSGEMKKYLHQSRIRIRQAGKYQFVSILKYYDSLLTPAK